MRSIEGFKIGAKEYNIHYENNDTYFNSEDSRKARSNELDSLAAMIEKFSPQSEGIVDVGSNIGLTTLLFGQYLKKNHNLLAIEPNREAYRILSQNCLLQDFNPILKNCAVGEESGSIKFSSTSSYSSSHIVSKTHIKMDNNYSYIVPIVTLDSIIKDTSLSGVDFIKIDVEGHEWQVLKGAKETIKQFNPWIFVEFNSWTLIAFSNENPRVFLEYLRNNFKLVGQVKRSNISWIKNNADATNFLYENLVMHGCVDDLLIRLR